MKNVGDLGGWEHHDPSPLVPELFVTPRVVSSINENLFTFFFQSMNKASITLIKNIQRKYNTVCQ